MVRGRPNPRHFGFPERFRHCVKRQGQTHRALARLAGVSAPMIGYLGIGQRIPTVRTIARLAVALKVSPAWLAYGIGEPAAETAAATCEEMGARLQASREEKGLTKAALARLGGLSPSAFAKIENGGQSGIDVIESLAKVLGVSAGWLAFGMGPQVVASPRRGQPPAQPASATAAT